MAPFRPPNVERLAAKRNVKGLTEALHHEDVLSIRIAACRALGAIGDTRAVEPLIRALNDQEKGVRRHAALALEENSASGAVGDTRAVEALICALTDQDGGVRQAAVSALGTIGDARAVEPLIGVLSDRDKEVRTLAARVLALRRWVPSRGEAGASYFIATTQWDECVRIGEAAVGPLIGAFNDSDSDMRRCAASALGAIGDARAVRQLIGGLKDQDSVVRGSAASALGTIGDARAVEPLIGALNDQVSDVRGAAASALGAIGDPRAVKPLALTANLATSDSAVRICAIEALGNMRANLGNTAVASLLNALRDEGPDVIAAAARAVAHCKHPRASETLGLALQRVEQQLAPLRSELLRLESVAHDVTAEERLAEYMDDDSPGHSTYGAAVLERVERREQMVSIRADLQLLEVAQTALVDAIQNHGHTG